MDANPSADDALDSVAEVWINSSHFILNYVQLENWIKLKRLSNRMHISNPYCSVTCQRSLWPGGIYL